MILVMPNYILVTKLHTCQTIKFYLTTPHGFKIDQEPNATLKLDPMGFHRFEPCQETNLVFF